MCDVDGTANQWRTKEVTILDEILRQDRYDPRVRPAAANKTGLSVTDLNFLRIVKLFQNIFSSGTDQRRVRRVIATNFTRFTFGRQHGTWILGCACEDT